MKRFYKINEGKVHIQVDPEFQKFIDKNEGKTITVEWLSPREKRTNNQNNWYWATIADFSDYTGIEKSQLHEMMKYNLIPSIKTIYQQVGGMELPTLTTTELSIKEYVEFLHGVKEVIKNACPEFNFRDMELERLEREYAQGIKFY
jgi:hypothetical protein